MEKGKLVNRGQIFPHTLAGGWGRGKSVFSIFKKNILAQKKVKIRKDKLIK